MVVSSESHILTEFLAKGPLCWHFSRGLNIVDLEGKNVTSSQESSDFVFTYRGILSPIPPVLYSEKPEVDLSVINPVGHTRK